MLSLKKQTLLAGLGSLLSILILVSCSSTPERDVYIPAPAPASAPPSGGAVPAEITVTGNYRSAPAEPGQAEKRQNRMVINQQDVISRRVDPSMVFKHYGVNPTIDTLEENTSTFSIDADTASYTISQGFLDRGLMPDPAAIRVEEFVNAFNYGYEAPQDNLFSLQAQAFPSPYRRGFHILHLGVKGADLNQITAKPNNLTFLIDVSGSMEQGQRLEIVKSSISKLVEQLKRGDTISIVSYTNHATLVLEPTDVRYRRKILGALNSLTPQHNTNIQAGLELAYEVANKSYHPDVNNRIILCSDGVANTGETNPKRMLDRISTAAQRGIYLNTIGVGMGNYNDVILESLAKLGQGQYDYINSYAEGEKYFSQSLITGLQILARDVRLQVEFNAHMVQSYRLLGYENRAMDKNDFNDARKDAGEVGLGHAVTAVYEIKFRDQNLSGDFGVFRLAYKTPDGEYLNNLERQLPTTIVAGSVAEASPPAQLSYLASAFAEKLRCSYWSRTYSYRQLEDWLFTLRYDVPDRDQVTRLEKYIKRAQELDRRADPYEHRVSVRDMSFDRVPVLQ